MELRKLWLSIGIALLVTLPALTLRLRGSHVAPLLAALLFGAAILATGFMLSWGAEASTMISDKINQWTLLVGMLPLAMSVGAGALTSLPLDARRHDQFFLAAAQSLFGIAILLRLRIGLVGAAALALLFVTQGGLALTFRDDEARTIATLTTLAWACLALAAVFAIANANRLRLLWTVLIGGPRPAQTAAAPPAAD